MNDIWDDPELRVTDDYVKFEHPGDTVTGTVLAVSIHRWDDGSTCPQLLLDVNGDEINLTAGQTRLKRALAEQRPQIGDTITATFTEEEKRPGGKTLKHFELTVVRGGQKPAPAAPTASADDPLAGLTPEQRAAVEALTKNKAAAPF